LKMEEKMLEAHLLQRQGFTQKQIAEKIGVCDRTVRNYLSQKPRERRKSSRCSKLDPFKPLILSLINPDPFFNNILIFNKIKKLGYSGKLSILRDFTRDQRKVLIQDAVIRFETEPGLQAQVDWKEFGSQIINGVKIKLYAFVMILGYSRNQFTLFTTSMKQTVVLQAHVLAFQYFGGVPKEILYDNMTTAFHLNADKEFVPNKKLLSLACHYRFTPKRCKVRRPQTKGKVERGIGYLSGNFFKGLDKDNLDMDYLNEKVLQWQDEIKHNPIRELGESREVRFLREQPFLTPLPVIEYDCRDIQEVKISRESFFHFEGNRYSMPPFYIGKDLTLKIDTLKEEIEVFDKEKSLRKIKIEKSFKNRKLWISDDREKVRKEWEKKNIKKQPIKKVEKEEKDMIIRHPSSYEQYNWENNNG